MKPSENMHQKFDVANNGCEPSVLQLENSLKANPNSALAHNDLMIADSDPPQLSKHHVALITYEGLVGVTGTFFLLLCGYAR